MKLTFLIVLISVMSSLASQSYSQSTRITMVVENTRLEDFLRNIEDQSEYRFFYSANIDVDQKVSGDFKNLSIQTVLDEVLQKTGISYEINGRQIILSSDTNEKNGQQVKSVSGKVTDVSGAPLPGVTVVVKGTTNGTITDFEGKYTISSLPANAILVFSFVGMQSKEITVGSQSVINIALEEESIGLEEVVAIGYGTMKKSDLTGSVASISSEALESKTIASVDQALQGMASGVMASSTSGEPGGGMNIRIRGVSSYTNASEPLYVIDGIPIIINNDYSLSNGFQTSNPLASLNPADIESVEILKDASATSIYGSRGSNGVILITTKKGTGAPRISLDMGYTVQEVIKKIDVATGPELVKLISEFRNRLGYDEIFDGSDIYHPTLANAKNYDYQDLLFRVAPMFTTNLSIAGSNDKTKYYISGNYLNQEGILIESAFERYGFRVNLDQKLSDKITVGTNTFFSHTQNNKITPGAENGLIGNILRYPSFLPVYDEDGSYLNDVVYAEVAQPNPVAVAKENKNIEYIDRIMLSLNADWQIYKDLKLTLNGSYDGTYQRLDSYQTADYYPAQAFGGLGSVVNRKITNLILSGYLTYQKEFNKDLSLTATGGYEVQDYLVEGSELGGQGFASPSLGIWGMSGATDVQRNVSTNKSKKNLLGYYGRANINIKDKYLISGNFRTDGSSVFSKDNKWGFFPSGAFAWRMDQEDFIKNLNTFSNLKLRISYGVTGNGEIPLYQSQALWSINQNIGFNADGSMKTSFGGNSGGDVVSTAYVSRIANPDLKWERTAQFDIGFDAGVLDEKIRLSADYYYKKTIDAIIPRAIPKTSGFDIAYMNVGSLKNEGVELSLTAFPFQRNNFSWEINANATFMNLSPLDLSDNEYIFVGDQGGRDSQLGLRMEVGKPAGLLWGYVYDGTWSQDEIDNRTTTNSGLLGQYKAVDINGDNVLDANDKTYIGRSLPTTILGLSNRFSYKNLDLDFFIQGSFGNDMQIDYWGDLLGMDVTFPSNVSREYLNDYWTPSNTDAKYAGISGASTTTLKTWETNTNNIFDASYIRLKSITLSYNLTPKNSRIFTSAKIYVTGENLLTITDYPGYNPDVASLGGTAFNAGYDNSAYPIAKKYTFGVKLSF